ncbi:hypothetical protein HD806DRAFT_234866 [Xylariaceae sp. AK1471]|nr:hypothetical protein HD806DRAFT_234866 [Xylariaceae sp. AK1471]
MVPEDNPFIRFKNHVNSNVRRGIQTVFGTPALVSTSTSSPVLVPSLRESCASDATCHSHPQQQQQSSLPTIMMDRSPSPQVSSNASSENNEGTTSMDDVYTWAIQSPYSPLNLQHLRQPVPQGVHPSWEGHFTFRDAFEDLLVAGSGSPLPSLSEHTRRKTWESNPFSAWGPGQHVALWVGEVGVTGLWGSYFNLRPELRNCFDWRPSRKMDMSGFNRRLYFRAPAVSEWGNGGLVDEWKEREASRDKDWIDIWSEAMKVVRDHVTRFGEDDEDANADAEEDLYSANRSEFAADPVSARKDMQVAERPNTTNALQKQDVPEMPEPEQVTTTEYADGSKHVMTTRRKERDGKTEVTTTSQHFDANGSLLAESKETTTRRTWSGRVPGAEASFSWAFNKDAKTTTRAEGNGGRTDDEDGDGDDSHLGGRKDAKSGWFWKR